MSREVVVPLRSTLGDSLPLAPFSLPAAVTRVSACEVTTTRAASFDPISGNFDTFCRLHRTLFHPHLTMPVAQNDHAGASNAVFRDYASRASDGSFRMTNAQWAKYCREQGFTNGAWTTPSIDIVFTRCKTRGMRHLSFQQFAAARESMVELAGGSNKNSKPTTKALKQLQRGHSPSSAKKTLPVVYVQVDEESAGGCWSAEENLPEVFNRLTDPKQFTGSHKFRFDSATGRGRGLAGRQYQRGCNNESGAYNAQISLAEITDRSPADVRGVPLPPGSPTSTRGFFDVGPVKKMPQVYARLTDSRFFTGSHRHRFGPSGEGLGAKGRDHLPAHVSKQATGNVFHNLAAVTSRGPCDIRGVPILG